MPAFTLQRRVHFAETDMAGIVHFANFYRYMEEAEHAFFRSIGMKIVADQSDKTVIGWPRVRAACTFESPAYYDEVIEIDVSITRIGFKSLTMEFTFRRGQIRLATGELKTVCCMWRDRGQFSSVEIPAEERHKLEQAAAL